MAGRPLLAAEESRDWLVCQHGPCPCCGVPAGQRCRYPRTRDWVPGVAHTGRYRLAAADGIVPPLSGEKKPARRRVKAAA